MGKEWTWRPELGRWSLDEFGLPGRPAFVDISTTLVDQSQAYEFWREIAFTDFEADPGPRSARASFRARAKGLTWDGADFFYTNSDAVSGHRDRRQAERDGLDSISVGLVLRGTRKAELPGDTEMIAEPGSFFVYDGRQQSRVAWSEHEAVFLIIRRAELRAALNGRELDAADLQAQLSRSPLQHMLRDQLRLTARHMQKLDAAGQTLLLQQAKQSTLLALADPEDGQPKADSALFQAAINYIQHRIADPNLSADQICRALRCSRATLYRAFATSGAGIAETIRDLRLDGLRRDLEMGETDRPVADVAVGYGLYDTANLSRQFRRRFGITPSEIQNRRRR